MLDSHKTCERLAKALTRLRVMVTCWELADLLVLVYGVVLWVCHFPIGILGQVWYLIVSISDHCTLTYFGGRTYHIIGNLISRLICKTFICRLRSDACRWPALRRSAGDFLSHWRGVKSGPVSLYHLRWYILKDFRTAPIIYPLSLPDG